MTAIDVAGVWEPAGISGPRTVDINVNRGLIESVHETTGPVSDVLLAPGFIDLQVNGIDDVDVWSAEGDDWGRLDQQLVSQGVTSWCPTLITAPKEHYAARLAELARARAVPGIRPSMLGAHLEGPFLGSKPGAHNPDLICPPDLAWLEDLDHDDIAIITVGAEHDSSPAAVAAFAANGVCVSLGHTAPDALQAQAAFDAGAGMVTHLYNAMNQPAGRAPGLAGVALTLPHVRAGLIADLVHVHPTMIKLAFDAKGGDGVALVSDAIAWRTGRFDGRMVTIRDGAPWLDDGRLAGSCLTIPRALSNVVGRCGVPLRSAIAAVTTTPASVLGLTDRGHVRPGMRADLVALDRDTLEPIATWVGGQQCWGRPWGRG